MFNHSLASDHIIFLGILEEVLSIDKFQKGNVRLKKHELSKEPYHCYSEFYNQRGKEVENLVLGEEGKGLPSKQNN